MIFLIKLAEEMYQPLDPLYIGVQPRELDEARTLARHNYAALLGSAAASAGIGLIAKKRFGLSGMQYAGAAIVPLGLAATGISTYLANKQILDRRIENGQPVFDKEDIAKGVAPISHAHYLGSQAINHAVNVNEPMRLKADLSYATGQFKPKI